MPRNGLNESTSLPSATVKVPPPCRRPTPEAVVAAPGTSSGPEQREGGGRRGGTGTVRPVPDSRPTADPAGRPARGPACPHEHVLHGVARPDPTRGCPRPTANTLPELLDHLAAERGWYDLATTHLDSLASVVAVRDGGEGARGTPLEHLVADALFLLHPGRQKQGLHRDLARKS